MAMSITAPRRSRAAPVARSASVASDRSASDDTDRSSAGLAAVWSTAHPATNNKIKLRLMRTSHLLQPQPGQLGHALAGIGGDGGAVGGDVRGGGVLPAPG